QPAPRVEERAIVQPRALAIPHPKADDLREPSHELDLAKLLLQSTALVIGCIYARQAARRAELFDNHRQVAAVGTWLGDDVVEVPVDGHVAGPLAAHPVVGV